LLDRQEARHEADSRWREDGEGCQKPKKAKTFVPQRLLCVSAGFHSSLTGCIAGSHLPLKHQSFEFVVSMRYCGAVAFGFLFPCVLYFSVSMFVVLFVMFDDIFHIECQKNYLLLFTSQKEYRFRSTITEFLSKLPHTFIKTHKGFIINSTKIESFNTNYIYIDNKRIPISKSHKEEVLQKLNHSLLSL